MTGSTRRVRVERITVSADGEPGRDGRPDMLAVEEPVQISVLSSVSVSADGVSGSDRGPDISSLTMRTPGHDIDLALGWLVGEGTITGIDDVVGVAQRSRGEGLDRAASVRVRLREGLAGPAGRAFTISSACGICGSDSIEAVRLRARWDVESDRCQVAASVLMTLPQQLRERQATFDRTGGLHAAGLFRADGTPVVVREDVGRHNAVDKVIGYAAREELLPLRGHVLQVSGRASMELVYKAIMAGIPVLSAVSAPSSLAVELARAQGLTLAGFVRGRALNLYARADRVT